MVVQEHSLTIEDLFRFENQPENDGKRFELINGGVVEVSPSFVPSMIGVRISTRLQIFVEKHDLGYITGADGGYILSDEDRFIPDVAFVSKERLPEYPERDATIPPDLAIEVKSPTDRVKVLQKKAVDYINFGTKIVWVVYPDTQTVEVYTATEDGNLNVVTFGVNDTLDGAEVLSGFTLPIREIFPI